MNILIALHTAPFSEKNRETISLAAQGKNIFFASAKTDEEQYRRLLPQAEVVIGNISLADISAASSLKFLQAVTAGVEYYTEAAQIPAGLVLANASGAFGGIIAEYILGGILSLYRRFPAYLTQQASGLWKDAGSEDCLEGRQALILGTGDIGCQTALRLKAFGVRTVGIRRKADVCPPEFDVVYPLTCLEERLPEADIVIGCLPKTPLTTGLFDRRRLSLMKKGAVFVNVGRGSLIDTEALTDALNEGKLSGAVLDVTDPEPLPQGHPLWQAKNVLITPHISGIGFGHTPRVEEKITQICCENLRAYIDGKPLRNLVELAGRSAGKTAEERTAGC